MTGDRPTRPPRADARRNRARVLEAAEQAFADEGLGVPLDEIARRAGVGAGTVYRHFPSKEALFEAVIHDRIEQLVQDARSLAGAGDPGEGFFSFLARMVGEAVVKKDMVDALAGAGLDLSSTAQAKRDLRDAGAPLLARAQHVGAVRADVDIGDVMALLSGTILALQQADRAESGRRDRLITVLADGLRAASG